MGEVYQNVLYSTEKRYIKNLKSLVRDNKIYLIIILQTPYNTYLSFLYNLLYSLKNNAFR